MTRIGQLDPVTRPQQRTRGHHAIHHRAELCISEQQRVPAPMAGRTARLAGAHIAHERVDAHVTTQRRPSLMTAQGGEQAALGDPALTGVDRSIARGHGSLRRRWELGASPRPRS